MNPTDIPRIQVSTLTGNRLAYYVSLAEGAERTETPGWLCRKGEQFAFIPGIHDFRLTWEDMGPVIHKNVICWNVMHYHEGKPQQFRAHIDQPTFVCAFGEDEMTAALRCRVKAAFGEDVAWFECAP